MSDHALIVEVGPRDGLQNEKTFVPTERKIELINALSRCGLKRIETTSFVSPKWVPQMADAAEVMTGIDRRKGVEYSVLTPNLKGFEAAVQVNPDEIAIFTSASEGFCQKNINCSIAESLERFKPVLEAAASAGLPVRGYVSCVTECPFDGAVPPEQTAKVAADLYALGCREISLGDTIGTATPHQVKDMLSAVMEQLPADRLAGHFHDTSGTALANIKESLKAGIRIFDSSIGGLGGCPYAPGAEGNVATEAVVELLHTEGFETGIDPDQLNNSIVGLAKSMRSRS